MIISLELQVKESVYSLSVVTNDSEQFSVVSPIGTGLDIVDAKHDKDSECLTVEVKVEDKFCHIVFCGELHTGKDVDIYCVEPECVKIVSKMFDKSQSELLMAAC